MSKSYRKKFDKDKAAKYDLILYAGGSVSHLLWQLESPILDEIVKEMRRTKKHIEYLDFACGTGRILSFLEDKVDSATGIDVSQAMLARAAKKVRHAALLCLDITRNGSGIEGRYDLITCFRFLKNAEPDLRSAALQKLALSLKTPDSRLVVNNHGGNPFSYRFLLIPYHWLRALFSGRKLKSYLSNREALAVIHGAGLVVERVIGLGFISGKLLRFIPWSLALWIERRLVGVPLLQGFGMDQIFVCRLPEPKER